MLLYRNKLKLYLFGFILFFVLNVYGGDSFITNLEYAKMLYQNPRGIGCDKCHGIDGEGKILTKYKEKGRIIYLKSPKINNISKEDFFKSFEQRHKIMPKYFLTYQEINSLFFYLQKIKKQRIKKRKKRGKK